MTTTRVNRGWLLRLAKEGKLLGTTGFYLGADDITQEYYDKDKSKYIPVKIIANNDEWEEGKFNLREWDFKTKSGTAYKNEDGTFTLIIHSNSSVRLKRI